MKAEGLKPSAMDKKTLMERFKALANLKKGPKTTILGIVVILASIASVFIVDGIRWGSAVIGLMVGCGLLFSGDPKKFTGAGMLALTVLLAGCSGCCSYEKCVDKYGTDTVMQKVKVPVDTFREVKVPVPADTVTVTDTFHKIPYEPKTVKSQEGRAIVTYWRDKYTHALHMQAECDTVTVRDTLRFTDTFMANVPMPVLKEPDKQLGFFGRLWAGITYWAGWLLYLIAFLAILKFIIRKIINV